MASSRHEILIRITLLQTKTLIETKNCTVKCLKWHYSTVRSMKMLQCWRRTGHRPHPGGFQWQLKSPHPWEFAFQGKKMLMPGGQQQLDAAEIDWCITVTENIMQLYTKMEESTHVHFYLKSLKEICQSLATIFRKFGSPPVTSAKNLVISLREFEIILLLFSFPWKTSFFVYVPMRISKGTNIGDHWFQFSHEAGWGIFVSYCSGVQKCIDWLTDVFYNSKHQTPPNS